MTSIELPQIDDLRDLFLQKTPLLDVRAPVEFLQGAFPGAENHPLINDDEREKIGRRYKNSGQDEAVVLGHELVSGDIKTQRIKHWKQFIEQHPEGVLYCFRGGMRSKISQQWIYENTGIIYPRVKGGYKRMRRFLIDELEASVNEIQPLMLGGRTGIGKTVLLYELKQKIDLEGLFHHRGSVFGKHVTDQPSQIDIENNLSIELLRQRQQLFTTLVFEDEAPNIGSRRIPEVLFNKMKQAPLIMLEASVDERIEITFAEYIDESLAEHQKYYGAEQGFEKWAEQLQAAVDKLQRRLGGVRHKVLKSSLDDAIEQQRQGQGSDYHRHWIESLLVDYYDPMYDYQTSKKEQRIIFKGDKSAVKEFLQSEYQLT